MNMTSLQAHLSRISKEVSLPRSHADYLWKLRESGFNPKVIYDIGSCVLHWTHVAQKVWPEAEIILFDAFSPAMFLYKDYDYFIGVLSDQDDKDIKFYQNDFFPGGNSYYREVGSRGHVFFPPETYIEWKSRSLDSVVWERQFPLPDLIKLDVQGAEKDIIAGGRSVVRHAQRLIVEMQDVEYNEGAPKVMETLPFIESLGFRCCDPKFSDNGPDADYGFISRSAERRDFLLDTTHMLGPGPPFKILPCPLSKYGEGGIPDGDEQC